MGILSFNSFQFKNVLFHLLLSRTTFMMNNERGPIYKWCILLESMLLKGTNLICILHDHS